MSERSDGGQRRAPQVKGAPVHGVVFAIRRICPPGTIAKMLPLLPPEVAAAVEHDRFLVAGWYPLSHYRAIFAAAMSATGRDVDLVRALSRDAMLHDFRGIYRLLTFVLSPAFIMRRSPPLFGRYYDTGTLGVPVARDGYCEAHYRGCVGFDRVLWENVLGGATAVLEAGGAKDVRVKAVRGGGDRDEEMDMIGEWR
jgi:hypothetical protein